MATWEALPWSVPGSGLAGEPLVPFPTRVSCRTSSLPALSPREKEKLVTSCVVTVERGLSHSSRAWLRSRGDSADTAQTVVLWQGPRKSHCPLEQQARVTVMVPALSPGKSFKFPQRELSGYPFVKATPWLQSHFSDCVTKCLCGDVLPHPLDCQPGTPTTQ